MIDARNNTLTDDRINGTSQVTGVCRCTYLVEDNTEGITFLTQANHGLHEIVAESGVQPGSTDNHGTGAICQGMLLTSQLGTTIYRIRASRFGFLIRYMSRAIEHIVGGDLDELSLIGFSSSCQIAHCISVQLGTEFDILFCLVHRCIGRTVHNHVNVIRLHEIKHGLFIADIEFGYIGKEIGVLRMFRRKYPHLIPQLTVGTGY